MGDDSAREKAEAEQERRSKVMTHGLATWHADAPGPGREEAAPPSEEDEAADDEPPG